MNLRNAIQLAARNTGIALKKVAIDDSEFPFLVGVICGESDFLKLTEQIKKIDGYEYNGGTGSHTCNAFSIVPYRAYPPEASQHIHQGTFPSAILSQQCVGFTNAARKINVIIRKHTGKTFDNAAHFKSIGS